MKRILSLLAVVILLTLSLFQVVTKSQADCDPTSIQQCTDLNWLQNYSQQLNQKLTESENATHPLQSQLQDMQNQINAIKQRVAAIGADLVVKQKNIDDGYKQIAQKEKLLNATIRNYYIQNSYNSPLTIFLSGTSALQITQALVYQKAAADQDKAIITNIALSIASLQQQKQELQTEETSLAALKTSLDAQSQKLNTIIQGAIAYQQSLTAQISQISSQQQSVIAAKEAALSATAGSSINTQTSSSGACPPTPINYDPNSTTIRVSTPNGIQTMLLETYLKGLGEMPRSWESAPNYQEAFKAQVIAARTYALYKMVRSSCRNFDVYSDTRDQNWTGDTGDSNWSSAVDATKGQFMQNGGNVIIAYYSANSGGHTLSPQEAWNGGGGFPVGVDDTGQDGKPNGDLNARCIGTLQWEYHYNIGRDGSIQYNDTCPGGDINNSNSPLTESEVEYLVDATIWAQEKGSVPDSSVSFDQIKSDIGGDAVGTIQSISANIVDNKYTSTVHVVGSNRTTDLNAQTFRLVFNILSPGKYVIPATAYGAQFVKFDILTSDQAHGTQGPGWYFYTYGYGHRIGLDQEGALGMASQGGSYGSYTNIISHYYQGTTLTSVGYSGTVQ